MPNPNEGFWLVALSAATHPIFPPDGEHLTSSHLPLYPEPDEGFVAERLAVWFCCMSDEREREEDLVDLFFVQDLNLGQAILWSEAEESLENFPNIKGNFGSNECSAITA